MKVNQVAHDKLDALYETIRTALIEAGSVMDATVFNEPRGDIAGNAQKVDDLVLSYGRLLGVLRHSRQELDGLRHMFEGPVDAKGDDAVPTPHELSPEALHQHDIPPEAWKIFCGDDAVSKLYAYRKAAKLG